MAPTKYHLGTPLGGRVQSHICRVLIDFETTKKCRVCYATSCIQNHTVYNNLNAFTVVKRLVVQLISTICGQYSFTIGNTKIQVSVIIGTYMIKFYKSTSKIIFLFPEQKPNVSTLSLWNRYVYMTLDSSKSLRINIIPSATC